MTTAFSFLRVGQLIRKHWEENVRLYFMSILAIMAILSLAFTFWTFATGPNYHEEGVYIIYLFGLFICGCAFASISFSMLGEKAKGIYWLGLPASHLEKLITVLFFSTFVFFFVYSACFFVIKLLAVSFLKTYLLIQPNADYRLMSWKHGFGSIFPYFLYAYFAVQALYLLGSVYFNKYAFIKTTVIGAALIFLFVYFCKTLDENFLPKGYHWNGLWARQYPETDQPTYKAYYISSTLASVITCLLKLGWAPLFWLVTWFRLKEKEL